MQHFTDEQIISLFRNCRWYKRRLEYLRNQEGEKDITWYNEVILSLNQIEEYDDIFAILDIRDQYQEWEEERKYV